jgi:putative ABC transport system permease protein
MFLRRVQTAIKTLLGRPAFEDDMDEELRFHVEQYTGELIASGVPPAEAARRARAEFGSVINVKADCREARGVRVFDELRQDLRYAFRLMRKSPVFTLTAVSTLAVCLGANLAIFAVVNSILLKPLPFPDADRLVRVYNTYPRAAVPDDGASVTNYYERRGRIAAFSGVSLCREGTALVGDVGSVEREEIARVSADFFSTLGVGPVMGRAFTDEEMSPPASRVAILTDVVWRRRFGGDPAAIGRNIRVDGVDRVVVGVLPPAFRFLSSRARVYIPLASTADDRSSLNRHSGSSSQMVARLKPGVAIAVAQMELDAHNTAMEAGSPTRQMMMAAGFRSLIVPLHGEHVAAIRPVLLLVQAAALCLLLIGAVNLVNLLLIRATARARELAIRQAIGGSRMRIVRQVIVETTVIAGTGGFFGVIVGAAGVRAVGLLGADQLPLGAQIAFDVRLVAVAAVAALLVGVLMAIPVAWFSLRNHAAGALQIDARGSTAGRTTQRARHIFLVAQLALAFVLLAGAGLLGVSLKRVTAISPGFRAANVLSGQLSVPVRRYPDAAARRTFADRFLTEIGRQPGVRAAGIVTNVPFSGRNIMSAATVQGYVPQPGESPRGIYSYGVGGDYFEALGLALIEGRFPTRAELQRSDRVCAVDDAFAKRYFPRGGAVGQHLFPGSAPDTDDRAFTIVGVVGAMKQAGLTDDEVQGAVFYPYLTRFDTNLFVVIRTAVSPESLAPAVRQVLQAIDAELAMDDFRSMETRIADSLVARRSPAVLAGLFSAMALLLTTIGTYGVFSYAVTQRRREIGLRMALGARPEQVRAQFLSQALRLLAAGTVSGLVGAWLIGRAMQSVLYQVPALHPWTLAATALIIAVVSLVACLVPSHRAARILPLEALADQ